MDDGPVSVVVQVRQQAVGVGKNADVGGDLSLGGQGAGVLTFTRRKRQDITCDEACDQLRGAGATEADAYPVTSINEQRARAHCSVFARLGHTRKLN